MQIPPFIEKLNWKGTHSKERLPFQSIRNIRDFRGMCNKDGQQIREGLFIRSAVLSDITQEDVRILEEDYHLCSIIDLRMDRELEELPDVAVVGAEYHHIPLIQERTVGITHEEDSDRELVEAVMETDNEEKSIFPEQSAEPDGLQTADVKEETIRFEEIIKNEITAKEEKLAREEFSEERKNVADREIAKQILPLINLSAEDADMLYKGDTAEATAEAAEEYVSEYTDEDIEAAKEYVGAVTGEGMEGNTGEINGTTEMAEVEKNPGMKSRMPHMRILYRRMAESKYTANQLKEVFSEICDVPKNGAVLWHCTEGKDRCGIVSALFLYLLDFDMEQIIYDYLLTNKAAQLRALKNGGITLLATGNWAQAEAIRKAYMADESYLREYWDTITEQYGSVDNFLRDGLEITDEMKQRLKEYCLMPEP